VEVEARRQLRYDVPLGNIRPPLKGGEPVEVFGLRNSGEWLPAHMADNQPAGSMTLGYRAGSLVDVYRGLPLGWVLARVHPLTGGV